MALQPLSGKLFVEPILRPEMVSKGGIVLPGEPQIYIEGIVKAIGPGLYKQNGERSEPEVKVGDKIIYPHLNAQKLEYYDEEIYQISERDIVAVDPDWQETEKQYNEALEEFKKMKEAEKIKAV